MRARSSSAFGVLAVGLALAAAPSSAKVAPATSPDPAGATPLDWRTPDPGNLLVIDTNKGRIVVELAPELAPQSVERVKTLARQHFYDGQHFFRVIDDFMDQTGDPKNSGQGGSTLPNVKAEFTFRRSPSARFVPTSPNGDQGFVGVMPVRSQPTALMSLTADGKVEAWGLFCPGVLGMARSGDPDSANSQFFLMRQSHSALNQQYTAAGRVIAGEDVVRAIKTGEPVEPPQDVMTSVRLATDLPDGERPALKVLDTGSAAFKALLAQGAPSGDGSGGPNCETDIPVQGRVR